MRFRKILLLASINLLIIGLINPIGFSIELKSYENSIQETTLSKNDVIDITVNQVWNLLSDTSNGVQIPIDVRTDSEWVDERIDTPYPEFPRHFEKDDIIDEESFQTFLELYDGNDIIVYCKSGGRSASSASVIVSRGFNGTVYNMLGGITDWKTKNHPTKTGNTKPEIPRIPNGPNNCEINKECVFCTQTIDTDNDPVRYGWDSNNDGLVDQWTDFFLSSEQICINKMYSVAGYYFLSVKAEDIVGSISDFSDPFEIYVNAPPNLPEISGETNGKKGESYLYEIIATDDFGDQISYLIDWGDQTNSEWSDFFESGEMFNVSHSWNQEGSYEIRVKAKDEYGAESDWSSLEISMPQQKHHSLLLFELLKKIIPIFNS